MLEYVPKLQQPLLLLGTIPAAVAPYRRAGIDRYPHARKLYNREWSLFMRGSPARTYDTGRAGVAPPNTGRFRPNRDRKSVV